MHCAVLNGASMPVNATMAAAAVAVRCMSPAQHVIVSGSRFSNIAISDPAAAPAALVVSSARAAHHALL
jgi:hypothetical protein